MTPEDFQITKARPSDLEEILALLGASELPADGVVEHLSEFFVARDPGGRLAGCAGIEHYGALSLLRSVAVIAELQKSGLGSRLVTVAINEARNSGVKEVVLLTTTARDFFARRFAFEETTRGPYESLLGQSAEWRLPHCSSAVVMSLRLSPESYSLTK
jgi:N-acetylglutamate synthase-like GNAT family acetyltransferase